MTAGFFVLRLPEQQHTEASLLPDLMRKHELSNARPALRAQGSERHSYQLREANSDDSAHAQSNPETLACCE
jgi:hypothetical protein